MEDKAVQFLYEYESFFIAMATGKEREGNADEKYLTFPVPDRIFTPFSFSSCQAT